MKQKEPNAAILNPLADVGAASLTPDHPKQKKTPGSLP